MATESHQEQEILEYIKTSMEELKKNEATLSKSQKEKLLFSILVRIFQDLHEKDHLFHSETVAICMEKILFLHDGKKVTDNAELDEKKEILASRKFQKNISPYFGFLKEHKVSDLLEFCFKCALKQKNLDIAERFPFIFQKYTNNNHQFFKKTQKITLLVVIFS